MNALSEVCIAFSLLAGTKKDWLLEPLTRQGSACSLKYI